MSGISQAFRSRLTEALDADPRSKREIARASGYSDGYLIRIEKGLRANPTLGFVETIALTLGRDPAWMLGLKENDNV